MNHTPLNEFDHTEMRDASRQLCPEMTDEQFEAEWIKNVALAEERLRLRSVH
jgi:hypothetical protein